MNAGVPSVVPGRVANAPRVTLDARDAEVEYLQRALTGQEQIAGFDVAVHDPPIVGRGQHVEHAQRGEDDLLLGQAATLTQ